MSRETDVRAWLEYAEADRRSAYNAMGADDYRDVAFHCQQAVEKLLKAVIVYRTGQPPPYVHNLRQLLDKVSDLSPSPDVIEAALVLNPHYRATRYPGVVDDPSFYVTQNIERLLERMEQVFQWVLNQLP